MSEILLRGIILFRTRALEVIIGVLIGLWDLVKYFPVRMKPARAIGKKDYQGAINLLKESLTRRKIIFQICMLWQLLLSVISP